MILDSEVLRELLGPKDLSLLCSMVITTRCASVLFLRSEKSETNDQVEALDKRVTELFGFPYAYPVTGQTYSRKIDADVLGPLSSFGATVHKMATDSETLLKSSWVQC